MTLLYFHNLYGVTLFRSSLLLGRPEYLVLVLQHAFIFTIDGTMLATF